MEKLTVDEVKELIKSEVLGVEYCLFNTEINDITGGFTGELDIISFIEKHLYFDLSKRERALMEYLIFNNILISCHVDIYASTSSFDNSVLYNFDDYFAKTVYWSLDRKHPRLYKFFRQTIFYFKILVKQKLQLLPEKIYNTLLDAEYNNEQ